MCTVSVMRELALPIALNLLALVHAGQKSNSGLIFLKHWARGKKETSTSLWEREGDVRTIAPTKKIQVQSQKTCSMQSRSSC